MHVEAVLDRHEKCYGSVCLVDCASVLGMLLVRNLEDGDTYDVMSTGDRLGVMDEAQ